MYKLSLALVRETRAKTRGLAGSYEYADLIDPWALEFLIPLSIKW